MTDPSAPRPPQSEPRLDAMKQRKPSWRERIRAVTTMVRAYAAAIGWIGADYVRRIGPKVVLVQGALLLGMGLELAAFFALVRAIAGGWTDPAILAGIVGTLILGAVLGYDARRRLLAYALDYERSLIVDLLNRGLAPEARREIVAREARQLTTVVRLISRLPVHVLIAIPVAVVLAWLAPVLTVLILVLLAVSALPFYRLGKASALHNAAMLEASRLAGPERKHLQALPEERPVTPDDFAPDGELRRSQDSYQSMLTVTEESRLVSEVTAAIAIGIVGLFLFEGLLSIETTILYVLGFRFLMGQVSAVTTSFTTISRFYPVLCRLSNWSRNTFHSS